MLAQAPGTLIVHGTTLGILIDNAWYATWTEERSKTLIMWSSGLVFEHTRSRRFFYEDATSSPQSWLTLLEPNY